MDSDDLHSTKRFSNRVDNYVRYRPGYPAEVLTLLEKQIGLTADWVVADIGSGTGISTQLMLKHGNVVYAVEPNLEMRTAAERLLKDESNFHSISGTANQTTLEDASIDLVMAAQAFHWFDPAPTRVEFQRILKPGGWIMLMWNLPRHDASPFLKEYQQLLVQYGIDYLQVKARTNEDSAIRALFGSADFQKYVLHYEQRFDQTSLQGRLLSSSYVPPPEHKNYQPMLEELQRIFHKYQATGEVRFEYDTEIYLGQPAS